LHEDSIGLIPAAGKGLRLGLPYPKELYPVVTENGYRPVSQFVLENLTAAGLRHVVFVVNETKHQLMGYFGDGRRFGCDVSYVVQDSGGETEASSSPGLAHALDSAYHLTRGKTVYFGMADTIMRPVSVFGCGEEEADADLTLTLFKTARPEKFGMVRTDESSRVLEIVDKPAETDLTHMWGCIRWSPRFTEHLHASVQQGVGDFAWIMNQAIADGMSARAVVVPDGSYIDLGTYEEIAEMERTLHSSPTPAPLRKSDDQTQAAPVMSVVLVGWNNLDYLKPCLQSLYGAELKHPFEVVVVDNGSTDGSQDMLARDFPDVRIVQNDHNVGLAHACNQGIEATTGRHVLLLNNDTVVAKRSLDALVDFLEENPRAGAAGGRLLNGDGSFQAGYADFSNLLEEFLIAARIGEVVWPGYPAHRDSQNPKAVAWLSSACLLIRRAALDQVGLLDREFFIYGDEADLQYRLRKAEWSVYYLPDVETVHFGGRSMNRWKRRKMVYRGKMLFYRKNYGRLATLGLRSMLGALSAAKLMLWCLAFPVSRERASLECSSNLDVIRLCWRLA